MYTLILGRASWIGQQCIPWAKEAVVPTTLRGKILQNIVQYCTSAYTQWISFHPLELLSRHDLHSTPQPPCGGWREIRGWSWRTSTGGRRRVSGESGATASLPRYDFNWSTDATSGSRQLIHILHPGNIADVACLVGNVIQLPALARSPRVSGSVQDVDEGLWLWKWQAGDPQAFGRNA